MVKDVQLNELSGVANKLGDRITSTGFSPDCIIYIETGARLLAAHFCSRFQVCAVPLKIQRKGSRMKEVISQLLRPLPDNFKNILRRVESRRQVRQKTNQRNMEASVAVDLRGCRVLIVDDAVDTGTTILMARKWAVDMGADHDSIKVAAITITTDLAKEVTDFHLFDELCRFPWSSDSHEHETYNREYELTRVPVFGFNEFN